MASVEQIVDRLAREDPLYGLYRPGIGVSRTEMMQAVEPAKNGEQVVWKPNRKVVAAAVTGIVALIVSIVAGKTGVTVDPSVSASVVAVLMTLVGYLVPMSDDDVVKAGYNVDAARR